MDKITINLREHKSPDTGLFIGRPEGLAVRQNLNLDGYDQDPHAVVTFVIPEDTTAIALSFYMGLLYPSYRTLGADGFLKKYYFEIANKNPQVREGLEQMLKGGHRIAKNSLLSEASIANASNQNFFRSLWRNMQLWLV